METNFLHQILDLAPIGFAYCEAVFDDYQRITDIRYLNTNFSFKTMMNLEETEITSKKHSELFNQSNSQQLWVNNFVDVLNNQTHQSFKMYSKEIHRHFKIDLYSPSKHKLVMFVVDNTVEVIDSIEKSILLKTTNEIIYELNEDYIFTNIYTNYEKELFIDKNDLINQKLTDVFNEQASSALIKAFEIAKHTEKSTAISYQNIEDYIQHWYLSVVFYVKFDQEYRYVVSTRDITDQKKVEHQLIISNNRLNEIAKQSRTVIWEVDLQGRYTFVNDMVIDVFGYEPKEMIGKYFYDFYPEELRLEYKERILKLMEEQVYVKNFEGPYVSRKGEMLWLLSFGSPMYNDVNEFIGYRGSDSDITEKHNFQLALKQNEEKYRFITENTSDVIWILNLEDYKLTYISPSIMQLRGYTVEEAMAQTIDKSMPLSSWEIVQNQIETSLGPFILDPEHANNHIITIQQFHKNKSTIWVEISLRYRFNEKKGIEIIGISRNVTERKQIDDEIRYLSFHDQLTGLYNRRYYDMELLRLNTKRNHPISIIVTDINGLKMTNDVFGHGAGDELIKVAANTLRDACREDEIIVRTGGDEFLILLPNTKREDCQKVVNRIQEFITKTKNRKDLLSMSIGYSTKETLEQEINDVVNQADRFMYQHKLIESEIHKRQLLGIIMKQIYILDPDSRRHLTSLIQLVHQFAKYLNLDDEQIKLLKLAAMYHDIGKIGIDEKDVRLYQSNRLEYEYLIKRQPELSYQILRYISEYTEVANIILAYHENFDGTGYPRGLKGNEIPMESMMIHIVNNYDKLRFNFGLSEEDALNHLLSLRNNELEPTLCDTFYGMFKNRIE